MASLYRKWRSQSFEDLVGQEHVVRTLRNAVARHRVAHAYLFTGPRGTGKTSTARILAKAVNCLNPQDGNPCTVCSNCTAAQEGRALDVIEIDAASNTSVDNVRDLRERVAYAAGEGEYKVYIVDEVHRLSGAAFDAFLKTLEEPPPHVIFVFASTEPHKVPATIASRCQRFDFRRITPADTLARLREVTSAEHMAASDGALALVAHSANGSLRDALGLLDQVAAFTGGEVDEADVRRSLGLADSAVVARLTDHLLAGETGEGLGEAEAFFAGGGDPAQLMGQLLGYWRAILLAVVTRGARQAEVDPGLREHVQRHAAALDEQRVLRVLHALTAQEFSSRYDLAASLPFEVGYVRAALDLRTAPTERVTTMPRETSPVIMEPAPAPRPAVARPTPPPAESTPPAAPAADTTPEAVSAFQRTDGGAPVPPASANGGSSDVEGAWGQVVAAMRAKSPSLQAVLRSGHLLKAEDGEVTIGFLYDFHRDQFSDAKKRRVLEEVIAEVLGSSYRVQCVRASKEEIEAVRGAGAVLEDDGFIDEAAERLRQYHARQLQGGNS